MVEYALTFTESLIKGKLANTFTTMLRSDFHLRVRLSCDATRSSGLLEPNRPEELHKALFNLTLMAATVSGRKITSAEFPSWTVTHYTCLMLVAVLHIFLSWLHKCTCLCSWMYVTLHQDGSHEYIREQTLSLPRFTLKLTRLNGKQLWALGVRSRFISVSSVGISAKWGHLLPSPTHLGKVERKGNIGSSCWGKMCGKNAMMDS